VSCFEELIFLFFEAEHKLATGLQFLTFKVIPFFQDGDNFCCTPLFKIIYDFLNRNDRAYFHVEAFYSFKEIQKKFFGCSSYDILF
jgi:hypothetical protein